MTAVELIMVVLFLAGAGFLVAGGLMPGEKGFTKTEKCWFVAAVCWLVLFGIIDFVTPTKHYRRGQIDALTGKVKYELITHEDQTSEWVLIEDAESGGAR